MSEEHTSSTTSPGTAFLGYVALFAVPALMIAMLALTGVAFVGAMSRPEVKVVEPPTAPPPTTPAPDGGPGTPGGAVDPAVMTAGQSSYAMCAACHGPDGKGLKTGPMTMAPSLVGSEIALGDPDRFMLVVLKGIQKESMDYLGVMAGLEAGLNDEQLAAVTTYVRNSFGNSAPTVTPEMAAAARAKFSDIGPMVSRAKLDEIMAAHAGQ